MAIDLGSELDGCGGGRELRKPRAVFSVVLATSYYILLPRAKHKAEHYIRSALEMAN